MKTIVWGSLIIASTVGLALGVGAYTFVYARGASYLTDNPAACANCHVMREQYDGWITSSHLEVAVCNDCHTPGKLLAKYATKASNGFWHSFAFTTGRFPDQIRIKAHNRDVAEKACRKCHLAIVDFMEGANGHANQRSCLHCHRSVGHQ